MSAMPTRTVPLSSKELKSAIEVLSSAQHDFQLTSFERFSYRALILSVDVATVSFFLVFPPYVAMIFFKVSPDLESPSGIVFALLFIILAVIYIASVLVGMVSLALNISLLRKTFRERTELNALGLSSLSKRLWEESQRSRRLGQIRRVVLIGLSIYFFVSPLIFLVRIRFGWFVEDLSPSSALTGSIMSLLLGVLLLTARYLRNQRERMDLTASAEELRKAFQSLLERSGTGVISVPADLLEKTAKIESAQIAEQRKDAVLESITLRPTGYATAFDRDAVEQRTTLDVADRIELEDLVTQLSTDRAQLELTAGAIAGAAVGATTKSKRVAIDYEIDHASRTIRIIAVRHVVEVPDACVNGAGHA